RNSGKRAGAGRGGRGGAAADPAPTASKTAAELQAGPLRTTYNTETTEITEISCRSQIVSDLCVLCELCVQGCEPSPFSRSKSRMKSTSASTPCSGNAL